MSFLNPVNEPVLRFKSTDAGAPQINYNARVAGDVKAVLKACLVTGYGATASAGWAVVNEVAHVAEFVSPSAAMSDYRLGINDTSAASTTWYYQYQDARVNPVHNAPTKIFSYVDKASSKNGWQLLLTNNGLCFIEILHNPSISGEVGRVTWFGQMQLGLSTSNSRNISYWCAGYDCPALFAANVFSVSSNHHYDINNIKSGLDFSFVGEKNFTANVSSYDSSAEAIEVSSALFIANTMRVIAKHPAVILSKPVTALNMFGVKEIALDGRVAIKVSTTLADSSSDTLKQVVRYITVLADYWEH